MKTKRIEKLMISGISTITNNKNELDENTAKIPQLWDDYFSQNIYSKTFNKATKGYIYGVYSEYESEEVGDYKLTIGIEVTKPKKAIVIENGKYLVFSKKGELPDVVTDAWQEIWEYFDGEPKYERAYKIDFEKYVSEDEIEIYISIL